MSGEVEMFHKCLLSQHLRCDTVQCDSLQLLWGFAVACLVQVSVAKIINSILVFLKVGLPIASFSWVLPLS